jgi:hypothetical protein
MSTPNESTPLISTSHEAETTSHPLVAGQSRTNIEAHSQSVLITLKADNDASIPLDTEPINLIVLLYSLRRLGDFLRESSSDGDHSVASDLIRERLEDGIGNRLDVEIRRVLDMWGRGEVDDETLTRLYGGDGKLVSGIYLVST